MKRIWVRAFFLLNLFTVGTAWCDAQIPGCKASPTMQKTGGARATRVNFEHGGYTGEVTALAADLLNIHVQNSYGDDITAGAVIDNCKPTVFSIVRKVNGGRPLAVNANIPEKRAQNRELVDLSQQLIQAGYDALQFGTGAVSPKPKEVAKATPSVNAVVGVSGTQSVAVKEAGGSSGQPTASFVCESYAPGCTLVNGANWASTEVKDEATRHARTLINLMFIKCGSTYFYNGSGLDAAGGNDMGDNFIQYVGAVFLLVPPRGQREITTAERLNKQNSGVSDEEEGTLTLLSKAYRTGNPKRAQIWDAWQDGPLEASVASTLASNPLQLGLTMLGLPTDPRFGGGMTIRLLKRNGRWSYAFADTTSPYITSQVKDYVGPAVRTEGEMLFQMSSYHCEDGKLTPNAQSDPKVVEAEIRADYERKRRKVISGDYREFQKRLPPLVQERVTALSYTGLTYDKEIDRLNQLIADCTIRANGKCDGEHDLSQESSANTPAGKHMLATIQHNSEQVTRNLRRNCLTFTAGFEGENFTTEHNPATSRHLASGCIDIQH